MRFASFLCAAAVAAAAAAAAAPGYDPVLAEIGEPTFQRYCTACHGISGRGDGPAAKTLHPPPANLTTIAARREGRFPSAEIARFIDGRFDLPAHGSRDMPVWGERFGADVPDPGVGESIARGQIASLLEYLKSIQQPPLPASEGESSP
jgi:mono/diheme cytochrome c family protein